MNSVPVVAKIRKKWSQIDPTVMDHDNQTLLHNFEKVEIHFINGCSRISLSNNGAVTRMLRARCACERHTSFVHNSYRSFHDLQLYYVVIAY